MQLAVRFRDRLIQIGGETLASEFDQIVLAIRAAWTVEHTEDDAHGNVHALNVASVAGYTERGRSVPIGVWTDFVFNALRYTGDVLGSTWAVDLTDEVSPTKSMLIGDTMWMSIEVVTTDVAGAPTNLRVAIPKGYVIVGSTQLGAGRCTDNGVVVPVRLRANAGNTFVEFGKMDATAFANSVALTNMQGLICFEVKKSL